MYLTPSALGQSGYLQPGVGSCSNFEASQIAAGWEPGSHASRLQFPAHVPAATRQAAWQPPHQMWVLKTRGLQGCTSGPAARLRPDHPQLFARSKQAAALPLPMATACQPAAAAAARPAAASGCDRLACGACRSLYPPSQAISMHGITRLISWRVQCRARVWQVECKRQTGMQRG